MLLLNFIESLHYSYSRTTSLTWHCRYYLLLSDVQRLADTLETKEEELQMKDRDLQIKVQDLLMENAELRNQVADLKEEVSGVGAAVVPAKESDNTLPPASCPPSPSKQCWKKEKEQQTSRTPATSCDLSSGEEMFDCETAIVHLLASHCSVISSSSRQAFPASTTSNQRSTNTSFGLISRKLPKIRELQLRGGCGAGGGGGGRRSSRGRGRRPLAWIYSPFIPRRIIATKEHGHDGVSDLSSCM